MRALTATLAAALALPLTALAQSPRPNGLAFELGGEGLLASLHYERLAFERGPHRVLARAGLGYVPLYVNAQSTAGNFIVPLGARYLYGPGAHHLELGLAVPVRIKAADLDVRGTDEIFSVSLVPSIGYRYEAFEQGRFFCDVAYAPRVTRGVLGLQYANFVRAGVGVRF